MLYRHRKNVCFTSQFYTIQKGATFIPKKDYDGPKYNSVADLKNNEILKKARMAKNAGTSAISINHLSPIRIENNFKDIEMVSAM